MMCVVLVEMPASSSGLHLVRLAAPVRIVTGTPERGALPIMDATLSGKHAKWPPMLANDLGSHQCDMMAGQSSGGSLRTSPTIRSMVARPAPVEVARPIKRGNERDPPARRARVNRTTPKRASNAPERERIAAPFKLRLCSALSGCHSLRPQGIDQHQTCDLLRITNRVQAHYHAPEGVADEHIRRWYTGSVKHLMQFSGDLAGCARHTGRVAPAEPGTVVAQNSSELRDFSLHASPVDRGRGDTRLKNNSGTSLPGFVDVQALSAGLEQPSGWRQTDGIPAYADDLIEKARGKGDQPPDEQEEEEVCHSAR